MNPLVTFDFHNTIATCDPWFYLEIRDLAADVLEHIDPDLLAVASREDITARYRTLREGVMASGNEIDAVESVSIIARDLGLELEQDAIHQSVRHLMRETMDHVAPVPGAVEAIRAISGEGISVGVVSSAVYHPFLEWTLDHFGATDHLAFVVTSASSGHYKSNPEIYRYAMNITDAEPATSIHIGDSPKWDVWASQQAGMRGVWFSNGITDTFLDRQPESEPDFTSSSMDDISSWVLGQLEIAVR